MLQTIGSDMEVFGKNNAGEHVALCGLIGGSKEQPKAVQGLPDGYFIQEDNVALEFNIPVCGGKNTFIKAFRTMRNYTHDLLLEMGLELSKDASCSFNQTQLTHPQALVFGCEPDYNAWVMKENKKPYAKDANLRTCGGHIHVGTNIDMVQGVRNMDLLLGVPSVLIDNSPASIARRELYGKAGAMRPKPYGFEYRTLSNFWFFDDALVSWVYDRTAQACDLGEFLTEKEGKKIQEVINTGDMKGAEALVKKYNIVMP